MEEFVGLRPKFYAFKHTGKVVGNKLVHSSAVEKKTAKGVKRKVKDDHLHYNHYLILFARSISGKLDLQHLIQSGGCATTPSTHIPMVIIMLAW